MERRKAYPDTRRFDRNADQISQILGHYRQIMLNNMYRNTNCVPSVDIAKMIQMMEDALKINDKVAEWPLLE